MKIVGIASTQFHHCRTEPIGFMVECRITLRLPGTVGIGVTETFAVSETGCELLTARGRTLVVVPG